MRGSTQRDEGFTLIEVMVVVLIIGVLLAIGVPTFLGAQGRAHDREVQNNLALIRTSLVETVWDGDIAEIDKQLVATQSGLESIRFVGASAQSNDPSEISIGTSDSLFVATSRSGSGNCYFIQLAADGTTSYGHKTTNYCSVNNIGDKAPNGW